MIDTETLRGYLSFSLLDFVDFILIIIFIVVVVVMMIIIIISSSPVHHCLSLTVTIFFFCLEKFLNLIRTTGHHHLEPALWFQLSRMLELLKASGRFDIFSLFAADFCPLQGVVGIVECECRRRFCISELKFLGIHRLRFLNDEKLSNTGSSKTSYASSTLEKVLFCLLPLAGKTVVIECCRCCRFPACFLFD